MGKGVDNKWNGPLSGVVAGTTTKRSSYEKANPAISQSTSRSQQSMALFSGAVNQGGNFSINISGFHAERAWVQVP